MKHRLFPIILSLISLAVHAQDSTNASPVDSSLAGNEPAYFLDSIRTNGAFLQQIDPMEIAFINVLKNTNGIKAAGEAGRNGAIFVFTKTYTRRKYWEYLSSKSADYRQHFPDLKTELHAIYILNGNPLTKDPESELYKITDANFRGLQIIGQQTLQKTYHLTDKTVGVVIVLDQQ